MSLWRARHTGRPVAQRTAPAAFVRGAARPAGLAASLQRTHGNQHLARLLRSLSRGLVSTGDAARELGAANAARWAGPGAVRFRLPTGADVKAILAAGDVPEDKLKDSMATALTRMAKEGLLKSKDPIPDIIKKLFPSPGKFDEAELAKVVDVGDRKLVYKSVADAAAKVSATDKPNLLKAIDKAIALVDDAMKDATGLKEVFGGQAGTAKSNYNVAKGKLGKLKTKMDTMVETDYNRDDEQTGLGGWAMFSTQHIHLETDVAKVVDVESSAVTLIHECAHLSSGTVEDYGYYDTPGFEAMSEADKVNNAAHYEELPWRQLGKSSYAGVTFKPGKSKGGGKVTFEDEVRREASEYLRKAWDAAVDTHSYLRGVRQEIEGGSDANFKANKALILEISKVEHLTIHEQTPAPKTINLNDVVLAEGVAHATTLIQNEAAKQPVPSKPVGKKKKKDYVKKVINGAIAAYGALTGSAAGDRALMKWLVDHYRNVFP